MISQLVGYLFAAVVVGWTLANPFVGVVTYWVLALARPQDMFWWSLGRAHLSLFVALAACGVWLMRSRRKSYTRSTNCGLNGLILAFLLLKGGSAIFAADQTAAWNYVETTAKMVLFYYVTASLVSTRAELRTITLVAAFSVGYLGLWGNWRWYVEGIGGGQMGELVGPGSEVHASFTDRNLFGYVLASGLPLCFFAFVTERAGWLRWPALACLPILANAVMLTFGRAAFLAMIAGSLCAVIRLRRPRAVLTALTIATLMMCWLAGPAVVARVTSVARYDEDQSAVSRLESWSAGLKMIADYPFLGVGPDNYGRYSSAYNPKVPEGLVGHNEFLQTAAEIGVPAALILVAIIVITFYHLHWIRKKTWARPEMRWAYFRAAMIESTLVCYLVGAMFVSLPFFELFYLLIALTVSLRRVVTPLVGSMASAGAGLTDTAATPWWRRSAGVSNPA